VLATALYAADLGIAVEAVLVPQPHTPHVAENLRAIAARARIWPAASYVQASRILLDRVACGSFYVPVGGSTPDAVMAYADAARELTQQVERGELPAPDVVVVALGSGGTAAGLAAGFAAIRSDIDVVAVTVAEPPFWVDARARRLAAACLARLGRETEVGRLRLAIDDSYLGGGYGQATRAAQSALDRAAEHGIELDTTYTAKTFAAACDLQATRTRVLYWHTLSSAPMAPLLLGAPTEDELAPDERALLLASREHT
jgi:D-cysteine desulfhydrase